MPQIEDSMDSVNSLFSDGSRPSAKEEGEGGAVIQTLR